MAIAEAARPPAVRRSWDAARVIAWLVSGAGVVLFILFPLARLVEVYASRTHTTRPPLTTGYGSASKSRNGASFLTRSLMSRT